MTTGIWYVKNGRTAVNWASDVSAGAATVDIAKLVVGTGNEQWFLFARTGQPLTAAQVTAAQAETTGGAVPAALIPSNGVAPGGKNTYAITAPISATGANDQAVINAAVLAAAAAGRSEVWLYPGTYAWDADISPWTVGVRLRAVQPGKVTIQLDSLAQYGPRWLGGKTQIGGTQEIATVAAGSRTITTAADRSASLSASDVITITSNEQFSNRSYYTLAEWNVVESVAGTTVTLKWPLRFTYTSSGSYGVRPFKFTLLENAGMEGIAVKGAATTSLRQVGATFQNCLRPLVERCTFDGQNFDDGLLFYECWAPIAEKVTALNVMDLANSTGFTGYGVHCIGTLDAAVIDLLGRGCRHTFDDSALDRTPPSLRTKVVRGRSYDSYGAGWSTHGGSDECYFEECVSTNGGGGFVLRGRAPRTRGCTVRGVTYQTSNAYTVKGQNNQSSIHGVLLGEFIYDGTTSCGGGTNADLEFDLIDVTGSVSSPASACIACDQDTPLDSTRIRWKQMRGHLSHAVRLWAPTIRNSYLTGGRITTDTAVNTQVVIDVDPTIATNATTTGSRAVDGYSQKGLTIEGIHFEGYANFTVRLVGNSTGTAANVADDIVIRNNRMTGKNTGNSSAMRVNGGSFSSVLGAVRVEFNQAREHGVCCSSNTTGVAPATGFSANNAVSSGVGA